MSYLESLDTSLFFALHSLAGRSIFSDTLIIVTASYVPYVVVALFVGYLVARADLSHTHRFIAVALAFFAALLARIGFGSSIRYFIQRPRPFLTHDVHQLFTINAPSFPSGHALFFFAFSTVVFGYNRKLGIISYVLSACICAARVMAGVHYPSDMLVGAGIGVLCGAITLYVFHSHLVR